MREDGRVLDARLVAPVEQQVGDGRTDVGLPLVDGTQRQPKFLRFGLLGQEAGRSLAQRRSDLARLRARGQQQDRDLRVMPPDLRQHVEAVHHRKIEFHERGPRPELGDEGEQFLAVGRLTDDVGLRLALQEHADAGTHQRLAIGQDQFHRSRTRRREAHTVLCRARCVSSPRINPRVRQRRIPPARVRRR